MKTILTKLPADKARKELSRDAWFGPLLSFVGLIGFSWIGIFGLAYSARALILTKHEGNKNNARLGLYRILTLIGIVIAILDITVLVAPV